MNTTQSNYANMVKRLSFRKTMSESILIYYSVDLIIYTLTQVLYGDVFNVKLSSYFSVILSVIMLAFSIINGNANYEVRIIRAERVLNNVKNMKRELRDDNYREIKDKYDAIMGDAEYRDDVDFFRTLKQMCREKNIKWYSYKRENLGHGDTSKLNNYLSEINIFAQEFKIIMQIVWYGVIWIVPALIFTLCFFVD